MSIYNKTAGILIAMLFISLTEFNYEFNNGIVYEGLSGMNDDNTGSFDVVSATDVLPDDTKKKKMDQLAIERALQPTDGNVDVL
jgi:hypothetical protein